MSHFASIATLKSKLEVDDMKGDKPVPEKIKRSFEDFAALCTDSGFSESVVQAAWERCGKGYRLNNVSDLCWALMNSTGSDLSDRTTAASSSLNKNRKQQQQQQQNQNDDMGDTDIIHEDSAEGRPQKSSTKQSQQQQPTLVTRQDIESTSLIKFYKSLFFAGKVVSDETEWNAFLDSLCSPLPMCFRLHQQGPYKRQCADILMSQTDGMKSLIKPLSASSPSSSTISVFGCSNEEYRTAAVEQDLCRTGHSGGLWSFQEFVSMLPVAVLEIQPDHLVFDMCAAPGSKSLQALDAMNGSGISRNSDRHQNIFNIIKNGGGCLVCNEKQPLKARQILPARMKRYGALQNLVFCSDATKLPWIVYNDKLKVYNTAVATEHAEKNHLQATAGGEDNSSSASSAPFLTTVQANASSAHRDNDPRAYFDRVICDVPCCGDGTARKDRTIFGTWNIDYVKELSELQLRIARRAVGMAKIGGLIAYSTCSMNPLEDEHVIFQLMCIMNNNRDLADAEQIELVDANEVLKNSCGIVLNSRGGIDLGKMNQHQVGDDDSLSASSFPSDDPQLWSLEKLMEKVPGSFKPSSLEAAKKLCTEIAQKVVRVLPHRDNTGGFFVALIRKVNNFPNILPNPKKFQLFSNRKRFELVHPNDEEWKSAMDWFGFGEDYEARYGIKKWKSVFPQNDGNDQLPVPHILIYPAGTHNNIIESRNHEPMIPFWCVSSTESSSSSSSKAENQKDNINRKKRIHLTTVSAARIVFNAQLAGGNVELVNFGVRLFERMPNNYLDLIVTQRLRIASEAADLIQPTKRVWTLSAKSAAENSSSSSSSTSEFLFIKNILLKGYYQFTSSSVAGDNLNQDAAAATESSHHLPLPTELQRQRTTTEDPASSSSSQLNNTSNIKSGSFAFCFKFPNDAETWLGAMLTPHGKIDLFVDSSVRRMLLQVYFGVKLDTNRVGGSSGVTGAAEKVSGKRRQRKEGGDDDDDEDDDIEEGLIAENDDDENM